MRGYRRLTRGDSALVLTVHSALDKVRAALSTSAQRELMARLGELSFIGVPAAPSKKDVRTAIERAWFDQRPLRITYVDSDYVETHRVVRIVAAIMDRHETRIDTVDVQSGERRQLRLHRIARAQVEPAPGR